MKKIISMLIIALTLFSCSQKKELTVENVKKAINGEATAGAKYTAFADQAAKDSIYAVEALFRSVAMAEAMHVKSFQNLLVELGEEPIQPTIGAFEVKSTKDNLQEAMTGETAEFSGLYPSFVNDATKEKQEAAITLFNQVMDAEIAHSKIFGDALVNLANKDEIAIAYFVCPTCGCTIPKEALLDCQVCGTPKEKFQAVHATMPLTDLGPTIPAK